MKKIFSILTCFLSGLTLNAQKGIEGLIQAEKNFAAYSVVNSTKEAFQQFIDSNSIMFDNGKPIKAIEFWAKREKNEGVLNWWPQYAEISASGDFGYTTGPWTFQSSAKDSIVARGQYITVWQINKNGEWKFLVDLGINNSQVNLTENVIRINTTKQSGEKNENPNLFPMQAAAGAFWNLFAKNKSKAYKKYLSAESILNRNGFLPAVSDEERVKLIKSTPSFDEMVLEGWGISPVLDMGYSYGSATIKGKTENFLHIWRRELSGWKIAVEVLRY